MLNLLLHAVRRGPTVRRAAVELADELFVEAAGNRARSSTNTVTGFDCEV